jgi:hypothetical protein
MSDGTEPAEEQPHPSTAKGRSAHSGGASERLDQRMLSRWAPPAAVLIAVVALAVAVWALLRPPPADSPASPPPEQIADAKGRACVAYTTVRTAVALQTHLEPGTDPVATQPQAGGDGNRLAGCDYGELRPC